MFAFAFTPRNWARCIGQTMTIQQNAALYSLLGVQYGGNGSTNFNLPDYRGRTPLGRTTSGTGQPNYANGNTGGTETVALSLDQMPPHNHSLLGVKDNGNRVIPVANTFATTQPAGNFFYVPESEGNLVQLNAATVAPVGTGQPHNNMQPSLVVQFAIALVGMYPSRN
jgi:microcystin-dependent protein